MAASRGGTITPVNWPRCMISRMHKKFKPPFCSARAVTPDRRVVNCLSHRALSPNTIFASSRSPMPQRCTRATIWTSSRVPSSRERLPMSWAWKEHRGLRARKQIIMTSMFAIRCQKHRCDSGGSPRANLALFNLFRPVSRLQNAWRHILA